MNVWIYYTDLYLKVFHYKYAWICVMNVLKMRVSIYLNGLGYFNICRLPLSQCLLTTNETDWGTKKITCGVFRKPANRNFPSGLCCRQKETLDPAWVLFFIYLFFILSCIVSWTKWGVQIEGFCWIMVWGIWERLTAVWFDFVEYQCQLLGYGHVCESVCVCVCMRVLNFSFFFI